ncbi:Atp10p [Saccharomyces eubayanus]|uniref:Atp10p n=1 Tax=Saccharomyces eubayanus TaxID=1080349 RepID=UPI0006C546E3|nr:ATP10-like protein [Saccharomyces eubayanus]KOG98064.1 ATP10-like protein [Saccharomyces eubayanus]
MQVTFKRLYHPTLARMSFLSKFLKPMMKTASPKDYQVKQLIKPVGLTEAPKRNVKYSQGNSLKDMFDSQKTNHRVEELSAEFSKSGLYEVQVFQKTKGKMFLAPISYWKDTKALYFPHLVGTSVDGTKDQNIEDLLRGKTSIVRLFSTAAGDKLSGSYFQEATSDNKTTDYLMDADARLGLNNHNVQIIEVNLIENAVKSALVKTLARWTNRIPNWRQPFYFECSRAQWPFHIREELFCNNVFSGYVFLVDQHLKVRWAACGEATPSEKEALWKFAKIL